MSMAAIPIQPTSLAHPLAEDSLLYEDVAREAALLGQDIS